MRTKILCIDASLKKTGWAILIDLGGPTPDKVRGGRYGTIENKPGLALGFRLLNIKKELTKILKQEKPHVVVCEEVFEGPNKKTAARLNNVKGVVCSTIREVTGNEPIYISATEVRACLGFKNNKEEPYEYAKNLFQLKEDFDKINDVTDAFALGFWYVASLREECKETKKQKAQKKKRAKQLK